MRTQSSQNQPNIRLKRAAWSKKTLSDGEKREIRSFFSASLGKIISICRSVPLLISEFPCCDGSGRYRQ